MSFWLSGRSVSAASAALPASGEGRGSYASTQLDGAAAAAAPDGIAEPQARLPQSAIALRDAARTARPQSGTSDQSDTGSVAGLFDTKTDAETKAEPQGSFERSLRGGVAEVGERPGVPDSGATMTAADKAVQAMKVLDRVVVPVGIVIDTVRLGSAFHADGDKIGKETIHTAGSVAGGWAGTFAGAAGGAEVGATIGLLGGPVGAAIGGAAGGLLGGLAGSFGGAALGARIADVAT